jgi:lysophospholipase L1-like esterase
MFWYHQDLDRLEKEIQELTYNPKTVFYGSSTFTLWNELTTIFKEHEPVNLGFGGATLAACTWFFDRVFKNLYNIDSFIIYAGDNDLGDGRHPEEVVLFLENLLLKIKEKYGDIKCTFISIKPSIARKHLQGSINYTNSNIKKLTVKYNNFHYVNIYDALLDNSANPNSKYFLEDGLHFNKEGYQVIINQLNKKPEIFPEVAFK